MNNPSNQTTAETPAPKKSQRILSIDILRGLTIAGMILVNNPGGPEEDSFSPLCHAEWIGLTPTDLVFPTFMFIMGITTYLSLRKFQFTWSKACARKIAKRAFLLWGIGLAISLLLTYIHGLVDPTKWHGFGYALAHLRLLGVLPRLGICYGLAAVIALCEACSSHGSLPSSSWLTISCSNSAMAMPTMLPTSWPSSTMP